MQSLCNHYNHFPFLLHHIDHYYLKQVDYSQKSDGLTMLDLVKLTMIRLFGFPPMIKSDHIQIQTKQPSKVEHIILPDLVVCA